MELIVLVVTPTAPESVLYQTENVIAVKQRKTIFEILLTSSIAVSEHPHSLLGYCLNCLAYCFFLSIFSLSVKVGVNQIISKLVKLLKQETEYAISMNIMNHT